MLMSCSLSLDFFDLGGIDMIEPCNSPFRNIVGVDCADTRARKLDVNEELAYAENGR